MSTDTLLYLLNFTYLVYIMAQKNILPFSELCQFLTEFLNFLSKTLRQPVSPAEKIMNKINYYNVVLKTCQQSYAVNNSDNSFSCDTVCTVASTNQRVLS